MEEIELGEIVVDEEIELGEIEVDVIKIYPELEDLVVTPSAEEQIFTSTKYGFENVTVRAVEGISEDLTAELTEQDSLLTTQEITIDNIITALEGKSAGGEISLQEKTITPTANEQQIVADSEFKGLSKVTVNPIPIKITNALHLFSAGSRTEHLDLFLDLCSDLISTSSMFVNCNNLTELDLSKIDTKNVTNMGSMFSGCSKLTKLDLSYFDTSKVTSMSSMFNACTNLTELDISSFDTSNVTSTSQMFNGCSKLTNLDLSHFDLSKVTTVITMFGNCTNLMHFKAPKNLGKGFTQKSNNYTPYTLSFSNSTKLTHDSLMSIINNLYDLNIAYNTENGGTLYTQRLTFGATNLAKLTSEEIAIATSKGYTVA